MYVTWSDDMMVYTYPLNPNIKIQFLFSCPHTFIIDLGGGGGGEVVKISREFILGDHTLNSHDLSDGFKH